LFSSNFNYFSFFVAVFGYNLHDQTFSLDYTSVTSWQDVGLLNVSTYFLSTSAAIWYPNITIINTRNSQNPTSALLTITNGTY